MWQPERDLFQNPVGEISGRNVEGTSIDGHLGLRVPVSSEVGSGGSGGRVPKKIVFTVIFLKNF